MMALTKMLALLSAATTLALAATPARAALGEKERAVLSAFNICWDIEAGKDMAALLSANGFQRAPQATNHVYFREVQGTTIMTILYFGKDSAGEHEAACRVTALKPQVQSPWTPQHPILPGFETLLDRIVGASAAMGPGYRPEYMREPHPNRPGVRRSRLFRDDGKHGRFLYVEESATHFDFAYYHAARAILKQRDVMEQVTRADSLQAMQLFVDDGWTVRFCNLNPQNCETEAQRAARAAQSAQAGRSSSSALPFSGIGAIRSGDNRTNEQRLRDRAWWSDYHSRCARTRC